MEKLVQLWLSFCNEIKGYAWIPLSICLIAIAGIFAFGGDAAIEKAKKKLLAGAAGVIALAGVIYIPTWFAGQINF